MRLTTDPPCRTRYAVNQWNMLLIGQRGSGMSLHSDILAAASWQAHVAGRKRWALCPWQQPTSVHGRVIGSGLCAWAPDYGQFPGFGAAHCADIVVDPGEVLYYLSYWWHETEALDTPTVGLTGLMVCLATMKWCRGL